MTRPPLHALQILLAAGGCAHEVVVVPDPEAPLAFVPSVLLVDATRCDLHSVTLSPPTTLMAVEYLPDTGGRPIRVPAIAEAWTSELLVEVCPSEDPGVAVRGELVLVDALGRVAGLWIEEAP